jgi:hypothetical protein
MDDGPLPTNSPWWILILGALVPLMPTIANALLSILAKWSSRTETLRLDRERDDLRKNLREELRRKTDQVLERDIEIEYWKKTARNWENRAHRVRHDYINYRWGKQPDFDYPRLPELEEINAPQQNPKEL